MAGRLIVCPTPIGNLEDVSLRLLTALEEADLIAAEDTRRTRKLLTRHSISGKLVSYHDHNEHQQTPFLIEEIRKGKKVALVSDGGTPAIADPGYRLVHAAISEGLEIEALPGPSAVTTALVVSGLPTARFAFEGFLPRKQGSRRRRLEAVADDDRTLVFFESPERIATLLEEIAEVMGERRVALVRELTKVHEEVIRGPVGEVAGRLGSPRGEMVLVVEGASSGEPDVDTAVTEARRIGESQGVPKRQAAKEAARITGVPVNRIYEELAGD